MLALWKTTAVLSLAPLAGCLSGGGGSGDSGSSGGTAARAIRPPIVAVVPGQPARSDSMTCAHVVEQNVAVPGVSASRPPEKVTLAGASCLSCAVRIADHRVITT